LLTGLHQLDPFQEWPQLLDPLLQKLVRSLAEAFLRCLVVGRYEDELQSAPYLTVVSTLPCAICYILNTLCKIRGAKVITRFLDNEPKYLEPMLRALFLNQSNMVWQERYIMLLWLSHLVLTPFDLQSISSSDEYLFTEARFPTKLNHEAIPVIASALISAGLQNLGVASKERESASHLLVRIALRPDMQRLGLLDDLVKLMFTKLHDFTQKPTSSVYECLGYLSILSGVIKSGSADDVLPFLTSTFDFGLKAATTELAGFVTIRASAPARKMLVTILRTSTLHAISLNSRDGAKAISDDTLYGMLEGFIQYLLDALADKDTPVRLASGKALSMLAQKLDEDMRDEVVQAILGSLEDDVLYEKPDSGEPVPVRLVTSEDMRSMSRNVTAVNPLKWQGLLLTLGHLLFRRTAPPDKLSSILKSFLSGLSFEQRTAGGTSIGAYVRDAACFGLWSLARKYATADLQAIEPASVLPTLEATFATNDETSILQIVADQLVVSACLDPSGNIRRGSSAALQELIGRHPDTIIQGIALVQVVDYHAVARRSHAMLDVAKGAAELAPVYRWVLLNALLGWRGVRAVDDDSRRIAAAAISELVSLGTFSDRLTILQTAQMQLSRLPPHSAKTVVEIRHGLLITISRLLDTMEAASVVKVSSTATSPLAALLQRLWEGIRVDNQVLGNLNIRFVSELVLEGAACLVSSVVRRMSGGPLRLSEQGIEVLDVCLTKADHDVTLVACADAAFQLFSRLRVEQRVGLVGSWVDSAQQRHPPSSSKGRILALGAVYTTLPDNMTADQTEDNGNCRNRIFALLADFLQGDWPIETQVTALRSLNSMIPHLSKENLEKPLCAALDNYANDQRGDIGSLVRMEAVKTVLAFIQELNRRPSAMANQGSLQPFLPRLFRLAGEKLDKLRFEAWNCIAIFLTAMKVQSAQR
jgi:tubulin-specific chaperone D